MTEPPHASPGWQGEAGRQTEAFFKVMKAYNNSYAQITQTSNKNIDNKKVTQGIMKSIRSDPEMLTR